MSDKCDLSSIPISTVNVDLVLFHQRTGQFCNGGNKPYFDFNFFCRHKYYTRNSRVFLEKDFNTYKYKIIQTIPNMIHLTKDYGWDELQKDLNLSRRNEYVIIAAALQKVDKCNGIFYDTKLGNEYIFSKSIVETHLEFVDAEINTLFIPEKEESGYQCSG